MTFGNLSHVISVLLVTSGFREILFVSSTSQRKGLLQLTVGIWKSAGYSDAIRSVLAELSADAIEILDCCGPQVSGRGCNLARCIVRVNSQL
jgi:hypothetical protein